MSTQNSTVDVPVLIILFNRPGCFSKVFEQVKKARPSKLLLYQDGAREGNENDAVGIQQCREIASDIDWDCEVYTIYYVVATVRKQLWNIKKKLIRFPKKLSAELCLKVEDLVKNFIDFSTNVISA